MDPDPLVEDSDPLFASSVRVFCARNSQREVLFFSGMWGLVWGSQRRPQVPYVIPRPGVPRHLSTLSTLILYSVVH